MSKINYQQLLNNALISVVKDALRFAQVNGLGENMHFFITFKTRANGVSLPDFLRIKYPDTITIVLQYSYNNLNVSDKEFGVQLTFDGKPFFIIVPFSALVEFKDPSSDFMLSFQQNNLNLKTSDNIELPLDDRNAPTINPGRIVSLDDFRKKQST